MNETGIAPSLRGTVLASLLASAALTAAPASAATPPNFCPAGEGAGQCNAPTGIAVDQSSGTVFVGENNNSRIDKFDSEGNFELAFGWGVLDGSAELQTCTTVTGCQAGLQGAGVGEIRPFSVAVDNALLSASQGDVYASDFNQHRIEKFNPAGEFLLAFGEGKLSNVAPPVAVDATGNIWVGDQNRLEQFSSAGAFISEVELPGVGRVQALAVDSFGDFYVKATELQGIHKFEPGGASFGAPYPLDASGNPLALTLDPATDELIIGDCPGGDEGTGCTGPYTSLKYNASGTQTGAFGIASVIGHPFANALAVDDGTGRLLIVSSASDQNSAAQAFPLPEPGPLSEENGEKAEPMAKTTATLRATVNPEGHPTTVHFEYVDQESFEKEGGFSSPKTKITAESPSIGEDFSQHPASVAATGLSPETAYRFRLVATNHCDELEPNKECVVKGQGATFTTLPPLRIDATYTTEVSATGATLAAQVNPLGDPATFHFEYLTQAEYEKNLTEGPDGFSGAHPPIGVPVPDAPIAAAEADLTVSQHSAGLAPATSYRYRIVFFNSIRPGGVPGPVRSFLTEGPGGTLALPDQRAWEMASPIDKNGGAVSGIDQGVYLTLVEAAANGEAITYGSPVAFADPAGSPSGNQYLSTRHGEAGWSTANIGIPTNAETSGAAGDPRYKAFSADLSRGVLSNGSGTVLGGTKSPPTPPLPGTEAAAGFGNFYLREDNGPSYRAILTESQAGVEASLPLAYEDATPDLRHIVFGEETSQHNLYEWSGGTFQLLNLLPGKTTPTNTNSGLGNGERQTNAGIRDLHALSADGSRAVWAAEVGGSPFYPPHNLYLRQNIGSEPTANNICSEPERACTVQVDASEGGEGKGGNGVFLAASADDSAIFFSDHQRLTPGSTADQLKGEHPQLGDLYRFQPGAEAGHRLTDLTIDHADPGGAEVLGVLGASDDGSYLYFAANGVLASNVGAGGDHASPGDCDAGGRAPGATCNLYLYHEGTTTFIATLAGEDNELESDVVSLGAGEGHGTGTWAGVGFRDARVSPDGTHLLFVSYRGLTGYDNVAANGTSCGKDALGKPLQAACPEVFRYRAPTEVAPAGNLACISCNPTGQRPLGLSGIPTGSHTSNQEWDGIYQSRALSADGRRAFFDSYDALVPQDTNGKLDVYEWEEAGEGGCAESSPSFSNAAAGCLSLISSGTGSESSLFMDASADGSDVFFITGSSLVASDPGSVDLYDAREGGGLPEPPPPPASCQGDACQSPPPAPNDPTPASSTYSGSGNEAPAKARCAKGKVKRRGRCVAKKHGKAHKKCKRANANRGGAKHKGHRRHG